MTTSPSRSKPSSSLFDGPLAIGTGVYNSTPVPERSFEVWFISEGRLIFERFGHTVLCSPTNPESNNGTCFDFGATSFNNPGQLIINLFRERAQYQIVRIPMGQLLWDCRKANRSVHRVQLNLTTDQNRKLLDNLTTDINTSYIYDLFKRNCATQVREILTTSQFLNVTTSHHQELTYRNILKTHLHESFQDTILMIALDLIGGRSLDLPLTSYEAMFLPETLINGIMQHPVSNTNSVPYSRTLANYGEIFIAIFVSASIFISLKDSKQQIRKVSLFLSSFILGTLGLIVWFSTLNGPFFCKLNELSLIFFPFDYLLFIMRPQLRVQYSSLRVFIIVISVFLKFLGYFIQPLSFLIFIALVPHSIMAFMSFKFMRTRRFTQSKTKNTL